MDNLQMLTQTWSGPLVVVLQILPILLAVWLLQRLVRRTVTRIGEHYPVPPELLLPLRGGLRWLIMVSALIMVLERLGMSVEVPQTALTGFAAAAAAAFLATWSVPSNLSCALLIFTVGPFRIGDRVELINSTDKPGVTGHVVAINLSYTTLEETLEGGSPGSLLQVPNSLFFQKAAHHWRGPGFSTPTKNGKQPSMEWLVSPEIWVMFLTPTALEIILGIDNIIFTPILAGRLLPAQQSRAHFFGLALAMGTRILLLLSITWVMRLTTNLFHLFGQGISGRNLIFFFGGLFLLFKGTMEIYHSPEDAEEEQESGGKAHGFMGIIIQIAIIDIIFSLDSVITAVGLVQNVPVMVAAIIIPVGVMMLAAGTINDFVERHPSLKMLALSFLIVVGTVLVAESFEVHVSKGYVYFVMAFSPVVETLNIHLRGAMVRKRGEKPVKLRKGSPD